MHKITEKKTSGQRDDIEKFVQSDVHKMNITDNIHFSRYLFLEQLNRVLVLYPCLDLNQFFGILNLIRSDFVLAVFDWEPENV